jgi:translation initiation factor 1
MVPTRFRRVKIPDNGSDMEKPPSRRVVFSTETGRACPKCGWPAMDCRCASTLNRGFQPVPQKIVARLRLDNRASGKHVTVIEGLPGNREYLDDLCRHLKKSCGTGGAVGDESIELQGDQRERLREILPKKGLQVKG